MVACFCNLKGYTDISNVVSGKNIKYKYTDIRTNKVKNITICKDYERAMKDSLLYGKIICTKSIVVANLIIRYVIIYIIKKVGFKTNQGMYLHITRAVFHA